MSEELRKINKSSTGTVPKIKRRNNTLSGTINEDKSRGGTSNLVGYWQHSLYPSQFIRNSRRNQRNNYFIMDTALEESGHSVHNGSSNFNMNAQGSSQTTSSSTSRRSSSNAALKCDNVMKYPDKKQIEDKLHQIQEYLKITNSLMTNMKNTDEPMDENELKGIEKMAKDLRDSEAKLVDILNQINTIEASENENQIEENGVDSISEHSSSSHKKNDIDINLDNPDNDIDLLKEQQIALMQLQHQTEKKLRDAKQLHGNLLNVQCENDHGNSPNFKDSNNYGHFDKAIKELEERAKRLHPIHSNQQNVQDNLLAKVESLENQILSLHTANDERDDLIHVLDNRDAELRSQHAELQNKLFELQNKKMQVDELVAQLHSFHEDDEEDIGGQVRKIVTMKDQLRKLKDMLEIVKTTENLMQNSNDSLEAQAAALDICTTAENYLEKESQTSHIKLKAPERHENNILRYDNDTSSDSIPKQVNKNSRKQGSRGVNSKIQCSISQKLALQSELESKKRELEEIMGKHKASTSNLNHDVGIDNKSEFSCTGNSVNEAWIPLTPSQHHQDNSDRFSSGDDCQDEVNDYPTINDNHNILTLSNASKCRSENMVRPDYIQHHEFDRTHCLSHTPGRNVRSSSAANSSGIREQPRSNSDQETRTQVHKQLQLIKSVCDSMLDQQSNYPSSNQNVQQLRNNLTPSPLYSEPRRYATPNANSTNAVNVANPNVDVPWFPFNNSHSNLNNEINNYNGWLATNTIQTQSFMLNTLNQCCQMLWLQQRELVSLRNTVSMLQERMENQFPIPQDHLPSLQTPHDRSNQCRPTQKPNHVSAAFSLPNLNQYNTAPTSNIDPNYINHNNGIQNSRMLDPCLNNVNINHLNATQSVEHANNVLHGVNTNINPNQMWNGQALNNQVAPGNRANNYWDNFRSYSRQNLLSTKNSDPHSSLDRPNTSERTNPFTLMTFSKSNSEQDSTSTSQENTPQRRNGFRQENAIPPPDVLNVNHNTIKGNEHLNTSTAGNHNDNNEDVNLGFQMLMNLNAYNDNSSNHSNISEEHIFKECIPEQCRRRNEWNDEVEQEQLTEEQLPKSKLCEDLRENVYKEVVSLISANESRPHFLIQLFRDLQMIGSDSLRLKILQSIQMIITHSLLHSNNSKRLSFGSQQASSEQDLSQIPDNFPFQSTVWSKPGKNCSNIPKTNDFSNFQNIFKGVIPFLNDHEDEIIHNTLLASLKQVLLSSGVLKETLKDATFHKNFSNILDEIFKQYRGKKIRDVKVHLLQTLNELLCGEVGFIHFVQETNSEKCNSLINNEADHESISFPLSYDYTKNVTSSQQVLENIQNGDLAEADQTRALDEDLEEEEEGAVGGIFDAIHAAESNSGTCDELELTFGVLSYNSES